MPWNRIGNRIGELFEVDEITDLDKVLRDGTLLNVYDGTRVFWSIASAHRQHHISTA